MQYLWFIQIYLPSQMYAALTRPKSRKSLTLCLLSCSNPQIIQFSGIYLNFEDPVVCLLATNQSQAGFSKVTYDINTIGSYTIDWPGNYRNDHH